MELILIDCGLCRGRHYRGVACSYLNPPALGTLPRGYVRQNQEKASNVGARAGLPSDGLTKQQRWKAKQGEKWRKHRAAYMRTYRQNNKPLPF